MTADVIEEITRPQRVIDHPLLWMGLGAVAAAALLLVLVALGSAVGSAARRLAGPRDGDTAGTRGWELDG